MTPLGVEIRRLRASKRMTLKSHAAAVGVTPAYLSALEHGHRGLPTDEMLERIAVGLGLAENESRRLNELLEYSRPKVTLDTCGLTPVATEVANRLAVSIASLSDAELNALLAFLHRANPESTEQPTDLVSVGRAPNYIVD